MNGYIQDAQAVALAGGGYVIEANVLSYANSPTGQYAIEQFYNSSGTLVNTITLNNPQSMNGGTAMGAAAAMPNGDVATAVEGLPGVGFQITSPTGSVLYSGSSFAPPNSGAEYHDPGGVATLTSGESVITLNKQGAGSQPYSITQQLYFQLVNSNGTSAGVQVAVTSASEGNSDTASVAAIGSNRFVVMWTAYGSAFARVFNGSIGAQVSGVIDLGPSGPAQGPVPTAAALADGGFVVDWVASDGLHLQRFNNSGVSVGAPIVIPGGSVRSGTWGSNSFTEPSVAGLPGGGYVATWAQTNADGTIQVMGAQISATDQMVGSPFAVSDASTDRKNPSVAVGPNGTALFSWTDNLLGTAPSTYHASIQTRLVDFSAPPPPAGETLVATGQATLLQSSTGWTSAAVMSPSHHLTVVAATASDYGSHVATEHTYDASGGLVGSATLDGYAGAGQTLTPEITGLIGGFFQVNYAGSTDYEIYGANGNAAFVHNQYTSPTASFTPLAYGGYVIQDSSNPGVYGVFAADGTNLGWNSAPGDAPSDPIVHSLAASTTNMVLTYAGSSHYDIVTSNGQLAAAGDLGASVSTFATAYAYTAQGGFDMVWLSADGGQYGTATSVDFQAIDGNGHALSGALTITQDLDPWHTSFQVVAHDDGGASILWSEGGGVFGAEYSGGAVSAPHAAFAGDLSTTVVTELSNDQVGFAWLQNGDVWAELFDPASGAVERADLGAATGDLSTVHALATANGGLAVSWHGASGVLGAVLDPSGQAGPAIALPGDLLGVDTAGHAVTLHDQDGAPVLQTFAVNDGLFWVH